MDTAKINCSKCAHFYITWDPKFPRGCRYFGFKSSNMPSVAVYASTGTQCICFAEKPSRDSDIKNP